MKIQIASDLHLEFIEHRFPGETLVDLQQDVDVLVLAGDLHLGAKAIPLFAQFDVDVVMVAGNHEFYDGDLHDTLHAMKLAAQGTRIHVLEREEVVIRGVRFLGTSLWSDFKIGGWPQELQMRDVGSQLNDFRLITSQGKRFTTRDALAEHVESRAWLDAKLDESFDGTTVVVTHHAPHPQSIHPRFANSPINGGFVSDLSPLVQKAKWWIHGHVHDTCSYTVDGCTVIANPHGYVLNARTARDPLDFQSENPYYRNDLMIEV